MPSITQLAILCLAATVAANDRNLPKWRRQYGFPTITVTETVTATDCATTVVSTLDCAASSALPTTVLANATTFTASAPRTNTEFTPSTFPTGTSLSSAGGISGSSQPSTYPIFTNTTTGASSTAAISGTVTGPSATSSIEGTYFTGSSTPTRSWSPPIYSSRPHGKSHSRSASTGHTGKGKPTGSTGRPSGFSSAGGVTGSFSVPTGVTTGGAGPSVTGYPGPLPTYSSPSFNFTQSFISSAAGVDTSSAAATLPASETDVCTEETYTHVPTPSSVEVSLTAPFSTFATPTPSPVESTLTITSGTTFQHVTETLTSTLHVGHSTPSIIWGTGTGVSSAFPVSSSSVAGIWTNSTSVALPSTTGVVVSAPTDSTITVTISSTSDVFSFPSSTAEVSTTSETSGVTGTFSTSAPGITFSIPAYSAPSSFITSTAGAESTIPSASTPISTADSSSAPVYSFTNLPPTSTFDTSLPEQTTTDGYNWGTLTDVVTVTETEGGASTSTADAVTGTETSSETGIPTSLPTYGGGNWREGRRGRMGHHWG